eukprot:1198141-Prymnesium_polylepis.1
MQLGRRPSHSPAHCRHGRRLLCGRRARLLPPPGMVCAGTSLRGGSGRWWVRITPAGLPGSHPGGAGRWSDRIASEHEGPPGSAKAVGSLT